MATKTFYFKNAVPSGATLHRSLQDGGTAPTAATTTTGWVVNTNAAAQSCLQKGGSEVGRTDGSWGTTLQPSVAPSQTVGDCWRSENALTGAFANTNWVLTFQVRSVTAAYTGRLKLGVRVWKSSNANGVGAVELTTARVASAATTANLSTTVDTQIQITWASPGVLALTNEYLFVNVGVEVTSVGSGTTQDMDFRVGSTAQITTPNFSVPITINCSVGNGVANGVASVIEMSAPITINCTIGNTVAAGTQANIGVSTQIVAVVGAATAAGLGVILTLAQQVNTSSANGVAAGLSVSIGVTQTVNTILGNTVAAGTQASISIAAQITAVVGAATATGLGAILNLAQRADASPANGVAAGVAGVVEISSAIIVDCTIGASGALGVECLVGVGTPTSQIRFGIFYGPRGGIPGLLVGVNANSDLYLNISTGQFVQLLPNSITQRL